MRPLALDHLTVSDAKPIELAKAASASGCTGVCLFLQSMDVLPLMPPFNLCEDLVARRLFKSNMDDLGLTLDLAYPFSLSRRTHIADFATALECAADLEAKFVNVLVYDPNPARRTDMFAAFCDLAARFGLRVVVEFYPASQLRSLREAVTLVETIGRPGQVGVNVDLLHLMRSGGSVADLASAPADYILFGQCADGLVQRPETEWVYEASSDRLCAGAGNFDIAGFVDALPSTCPLSVEIPQDRDAEAGVPRSVRAGRAVESVRRTLTVG